MSYKVRRYNNVTIEEDEIIASYPNALSAAINAVINLDGLAIEICGLWVWLSGNTQAHKDILKASDYKWAPKKKMWYYRPAKYSSKNRSGKAWSMERIRSSYGSAKASSKDSKQIAAA